jgi:hypothetical protein
MTPQMNNEVRDLAPLVGDVAAKTAEFFAIVLCAATAVTLGMSVMSAIAPTEVHAVTQSGDEFPVPEVAAGRREQLLAMPGAAKALEVLP